MIDQVRAMTDMVCDALKSIIAEQVDAPLIERNPKTDLLISQFYEIAGAFEDMVAEISKLLPEVRAAVEKRVSEYAQQGIKD